MTSAPPLVSVVVPTFRGAQHVAETLCSVIAQTHPVVEIIVVDDGSDDDTCAQVRAAAPQAVLRQQKNAGVCAARNHGLSLARGEFVIFLDQDDIWHPLHLARQVAWLQQHPEDGVAVCPYQHWYPGPQGHASPASLWPADPGPGTVPAFSGWVYHQFLRDCWALTSGTLIRRALLQQAGAFDEQRPFAEDWELWLRLSRQTRFALLAWPPVLYRQHPVQGSRTVRQRDYRTELLLDHATRHGLASRDGRRLEPREFDAIVARYQGGFGYHQLQHGDRRTGVRALWAAWRRQPTHIKALAMAVAGLLGWRPRKTWP
jgi:hypothetical protein